MTKLSWMVFSTSCCLIIAIFAPNLAQSQIVPDRTLSNPSLVRVTGNRQEITGGTTLGDNLFHSFEQFSLPTNTEAYFNNNINIVNIFSRVTGNSISTIDGLIRANGAANLFLLNPNGIIFGPNASLNLGGAFIASTANSIQWANNQEFSAINPQDAPALLTMNVPMGLQYGSNPGKIIVQGTGNNLGLNPDNFEIIRDFRPPGLEVKPGQTLALAGGDIEFQGGNITASAGRIDILSVRNGQIEVLNNNGQIKLNITSTTVNYGNISLSGAASVDASGNRGGDIQLQGDNLILKDGSVILADTLGSEPGGNLTVKTNSFLQIVGISALSPIFSGILTDVASGATGTGGNLTIETGNLQIIDGGQIGANTFGVGNAGRLSVTANNIELSGGSQFGASGLYAAVTPFSSGNGGNLSITTENLSLLNGAQISVGTFGIGNAGTLTINASAIEIIGTFAGVNPSSIFANVESTATGNGGNITIATNTLRLLEGGQLGASVLGRGNAGVLSVSATDIEISGGTQFIPSGLFTAVTENAIGTGGLLNIETQSLRISQGGQIAVSTAGTGQAGNLSLQADTVELSGTSEFGASGLFASAINSTGEGGDIALRTNQLIVRDGATINVSNFSSINPNIPPGQGSPGNLSINAETVLLENGSTITAATLAGSKGNITLSSDNLQLNQGSFITTNAQGEGLGGNITIKGNNLTISNNSGITANGTGSGSAGNILIEGQTVQLNRGLISASGDGGNITLNTQTLNLNSASGIITNASGESSGGNISIKSDNLTINENSEISASATGIGSGGNVTIINNSPTLLNGGRITATGGQGNIFLQSPNLELRNGSLISTNGTGNAPGGNIVIETDFLLAVPSENSDITANAENSFGGRVIIITDGIFGLQVRGQLTPLSDITVSSQLGQDFGGVVQINNQGLDPRSALVKLPAEVIEATDEVAQGCPAEQGNVFVVTGRGGVPENPNQTLQGQAVWQDLRTLPQNQNPPQPQTKQNQTPPIIQEAQGWIIDPDGRVTLISQAANLKSPDSWHHPTGCQAAE